MRCFLFIALLLSCTVSISSQSAVVPAGNEEKVQEVVGSLIANREKAYVLLRDLSEAEGHVIVLRIDDFELGPNKKARVGQKIRYADVLEISGNGLSASFVPDPKTPGYGNWAAIGKLAPNTLVEVVTATGETRVGRFRSSGSKHVVVADKDGSDEWTIQRTDIAFVYRLKYGARDISGGMAGGAKKGEEIGREVGQVAGGIRGPISGQSGDGRGGVGSAAGAGIGALIGAATGSAGKSATLRVLFYSR